MTHKEKALKYHSDGVAGKIAIVPIKGSTTQDDLSQAYSPGVAYPSMEIFEDKDKVYDYTIKGNLVAVISNGTAVLGLGNIGALASKPVMEGKAFLFKVLAGIDSFDIEIDEKDPYKLVEIIRSISPTFGAINLEDIKAPECFIVERELKKLVDIPVMHDDQHGTAVVVLAGLLNSLQIAGKTIDSVKVVMNGAGSASIATANLLVASGLVRSNLVMVDTEGVIRSDRSGLNEYKRAFATDMDLNTLEDAMRGADVFIGLSKGNVLNHSHVDGMSDNPIIFALSNPNPEIAPEEIAKSSKEFIYATGRSDYPNQINNALAFPYIFKAALETRAKEITQDMLLAASRAIASLAHEPITKRVLVSYNLKELAFGRGYILPKVLDSRLKDVVTKAVAKAVAKAV